jgi:hypothetical protein
MAFSTIEAFIAVDTGVFTDKGAGPPGGNFYAFLDSKTKCNK